MSVRSVVGALACAAIFVTGMPQGGAPGEGASAGVPGVRSAAAAKKGKKKKRGLATQAELSELLATKSDSVQDCTIKHALNKSANKVVVSSKVTINNRGQVIDLRTAVTVDKGESDPVRDCVDALIRSIQFPSSEAPLITIERTWTVANQ